MYGGNSITRIGIPQFQSIWVIALRGVLHNGHILTALPAKRANIESRTNHRERRSDDRR